MDTHTPPPPNLDYQTALHEEHHLLEEVDIPIVTVSATFRQQLAEKFYQAFPAAEVTFSRAHYSMALSVLLTALKSGKSAWLVDPTNYVTRTDWGQVASTHSLAQLIARHPHLKQLKDLIDTQVRSKFPLTAAIDAPLLYLTEKVQKPIISLHYEAGNILAAAGHQVIQVVTDPHVRPQYLTPLPTSTQENGAGNSQMTPAALPAGRQGDNAEPFQITYAVFDAATKTEFLLLADELGKAVHPNQIVVTGPPIDPRIIQIGQTKKGAGNPQMMPAAEPHHLVAGSRGRTFGGAEPLRLVITTGGLGQNRREIKHLLEQLSLHILEKRRPRLQLILYASTHLDFAQMYADFAHLTHLPVGAASNDQAALRILYAPTIAAANELLITHAFPWADGFITKPSGDMAYDAAAAGCFCLFLDSWGEWEDHIQDRFVHRNIGLPLHVIQTSAHLQSLRKPYWSGQSWFQSTLKPLAEYHSTLAAGCHNIMDLA